MVNGDSDEEVKTRLPQGTFWAARASRMHTWPFSLCSPLQTLSDGPRRACPSAVLWTAKARRSAWEACAHDQKWEKESRPVTKTAI